LRDNNKNTGAFITRARSVGIGKYFWFLTPNVGVEYFWVDLNGKHVVVYFQGRSSIFGWSVHDLDFKSMTSL
jgi:hypothetical protein